MLFEKKIFYYFVLVFRPQTTRSSARSKRIPLPGLQVQTTKTITTDNSTSTNITIIQVSSPLTISANNSAKDIFNFPSVSGNNSLLIVEQADNSYKSNVQIIPSNLSPPLSSTIVATNFLTKKLSAPLSSSDSSISKNNINNKVVTTVQVTGAPITATALTTGYGKIISQSCAVITNNNNVTQQNLSSTVLKTMKNFAGPVTNIPIGAESSSSPSISVPQTTQQLHYEQVFVTPSTSSAIVSSSNNHICNVTHNTTTTSTSTSSISKITTTATTTQPKSSTSITHTENHVNRINLQTTRNKENNISSDIRAETNAIVAAPVPSTSSVALNSSNGHAAAVHQLRNNSNNVNTSGNSNSSSNAINSAKKHVIPGGGAKRDNLPSPLPAIRKFLTRGLTEAAIIRPSRKDSVTTAAVVPLRRDGRNKLVVSLLFRCPKISDNQ